MPPTQPNSSNAERRAELAPTPATVRKAGSPGVADVSGAVRSVQRALALLSLFDASRPTATLSDLSRASGLATSTVQRLLNTLEALRFLTRDADGRYTPGTELSRLGLLALGRMPLRERAGPHLVRLSVATAETVNLGVLDDAGNVVYIRSIPSPHPIRHENESWLGRPFDTRGTAIGPALVGSVDEAGRYTTRATHEPDVSAASSPIVGADGAIAAAFSVTAPTYRIDDAELERIADLTAAAARAFSEELGGIWRWR